MKKLLTIVAVSAVVTGCASNKYCVSEVKEQSDCTQFNGMSLDACNAHVPEHVIKVESK